jgi:hypothetical protein
MQSSTTVIVCVIVAIAVIITLLKRAPGRELASSPEAAGDLMLQLAEEAVRIADQRYGIKLDYSPASIERVEEILGKLHDQYVKQRPAAGAGGTAERFGAYVGEVIRRSEPGARWERDHPVAGKDSLPLHWGGGESFPLGWCYRRIVNGPEDNVWFKYVILKKERMGIPLEEPGPPPDAPSAGSEPKTP